MSCWARLVAASSLGDAVDAQRLGEHRADRHPRVQRRVRVLEDHLHPAADPAQPVALQRGHVDPVEADLAVGGVDEADHGAGERRLAAAGLADEAERLPAADLQRDAVDGPDRADLALEDHALGDREVDLEPIGAQERLTGRGRLRSQRGRRLDDRVVTMRAPPRSRRARAPPPGRVPARDLVAGRGVRRLLQRRHLLAAALLGVEAARRERAARDLARQVRWLPLDRHELAATLRVEARDRLEQADGVRVARASIELIGLGALDDVAGVHDVDALGHAGDDAEVVGDEDERRVALDDGRRA